MTGKRTVYLLHGLMGTCKGHFGPQIQHWAGRHRLMPVDLPGHGRCAVDAASDYYRQAVRWVCAVLDRYGPGDLIATSYLGGTVAIRTALERPRAVRSLAVGGFAVDVPRDAFVGWAKAFIALAAARPDIAADYARLHGDRWQHTLQRVVGNIADDYDDAVRTPRALLERLEVPTLLVNGTLKTNEMECATMAGHCSPRLQGRVIEGAGHLISVDKPTEFIEAVEAFWASLQETSDAH